jgi:hypothetical protein
MHPLCGDCEGEYYECRACAGVGYWKKHLD